MMHQCALDQLSHLSISANSENITLYHIQSQSILVNSQDKFIKIVTVHTGGEGTVTRKYKADT